MVSLSRHLTKLPLIGKDIAKVGQVYNLLSTPCSVEPEVWVYAFWTGVPHALGSIFKPDPLDWAGERFGRGHGRGRKRRFKVDDLVKSKVPVGRGLGWAFFRMYQFQQRIGWYLLVADIATNFAVNWTSTAYTWSGCRVPGNPFCHRERNTVMNWGPEPVWQDVTTFVTAEKTIYAGGYSIVVPAGIDVTLTACVTTNPDDTFPGAIAATRIKEIRTGEVVAQTQPGDLPSGYQNASLVAPGGLPGLREREFQFQFLPMPGKWGRSTFAQFSAHGIDHRGGLDPDP